MTTDAYRTPDTKVDPALLAAWTAANAAARRAYYAMPNACTKAIWDRSYR